MSYSLVNKCGMCEKGQTCTDRNIVYGAICGIHSNTYTQGHQGCGIIEINCSNFINEKGDKTNGKHETNT